MQAPLSALLSRNAEELLRARYYRRDANGIVSEDFACLADRVASFLANAELQYGGRARMEEARELFRQLIVTKRLLPSSPILMNAGTATPFLAACYVLPIEDSLESILQTLKDASLIQKSGGGTGFSFSRLRPNGSLVAGTCGVASGPVSFIGMYDAASEAVKQGGRRRAANMGLLRVDHPDILEFIEAKEQPGRLQNFNLSVAATDAFMAAACDDGSYGLVAPHTNQIVRQVRAKDVLRRIAESAWRTGDPGMVFIDEVNRHNPLPALGQIEATNPCGEQPLLPSEACCLASINLPSHMSAQGVDWEGLAESAQAGVRLLDDAIDASSYPLEENERAVNGSRTSPTI